MEDACTFPEFFALVPAADDVLYSWVEGRLRQTDKETNGDKGVEVLAGGEAHSENRPEKLHRGNPERRANASDEHTAPFERNERHELREVLTSREFDR